MDAPRFDALTRALARLLSTATARRGMLAALSGSLLSVPALPRLGELDTFARKKRKKKRRKKKRKKKAKGPCAPGKSRKNTCKKDRNCCTRFCKKGRCRCRNQGQSCRENAACCPESAGRACFEGTCQQCDVCASGCPFSSVAAAVAGTASGGTIRLCPGTFAANLSIAKDLTLIGAGDGEDGTILDGQGLDSVIRVALFGATVAVQGLRITGGNTSDGGGIFNSGTLTLIDSTVSGNTAGDSGGGIHNVFTLTITGSTVSGNATDLGGGIFNFPGGTLTIANSTVRGNTADNDGGGIYDFGTISLDAGSHVCENLPNNCVGFMSPACTPTCPA